MRAAIYARVSSERQEKEHTIGSQLEALRVYAGKNGMEIVEEFTDEGYSGARLDRPGLDRMRDLAERREFEVLLAYCTDRLARKFAITAKSGWVFSNALLIRQLWSGLPCRSSI
jgi:site-specific DNA recombinase